MKQSGKTHIISGKKLAISARITFSLCIISAVALLFQYLALTDIAHDEPNKSLEWYITGICMIIHALFILSTMITLYFLWYDHKKTNP
jgi:hypothetical protein